jgi:nucleolin
MNENQERSVNTSSKKRKHFESSDTNGKGHKAIASNEQKLTKQHSLAGTRYGVLEEKVKAMIQKTTKETNNSKKRPLRSHATTQRMNGEMDDPSSVNNQPKSKKRKDEFASSSSVVPSSRSDTENSEIHILPSTLSPEAQEFVNNRTLYLQGLPFESNEEEIKQFFLKGISLINESQIKSIRLPRWHDSGKLKGYGHIEFHSEESTKKALEMNGQYLRNRYIVIEKPLVPRSLNVGAVASSTSAHSSSGKVVLFRCLIVVSLAFVRLLLFVFPVSRFVFSVSRYLNTASSTKPPGCHTIFIRNLPYEINEEEIKQAFMVYGPIMKVRLAVWNHTNNLKGFGYIEYKREDSAEIAVKKSGSIRLKNRIITVDYETEGPKKGYKGINKDTKTKEKK